MKNFHWKKPLALLGVCFALMFILVACGSDGDANGNKHNNDNGNNDGELNGNEAGEPVEGGKITIGVNQEPDTLDLHKTGMNIASVIGDHIGGALLTLNPETLELDTYLANDYEVSEDGKTITFEIKQNIQLHDGTELTAQVFKETYERAIDPETASPGTGGMLVGIKEILAPDELTLVFELEEPLATLLTSLSVESYLQPLSMKAIEEYGDDYGKNPVGVGPWEFSEWKTGQSISLIRNENFNWPQNFYENKGKAYPDELEYKFITDYQTRLNALDTGSIDIALYVEAKDIERYRDNDEFVVADLERQGIGLFLQMNSEDEVLQDHDVRKALNTAIDKEAIIQAVINGEGVVANGPLPSNIMGYDPEVENYGYKYNQEESISLLEESGWQKNNNGIMEKDGEELSFELVTASSHDQSAQIVQAMLKEIGVEIKIQTMEEATLIEKTASGDYELSFLGYDYNDPDILYLLFHSSQIGGLNIARVQNEELDKLLEDGRNEMDVDKRIEIYHEAQKLIVEEAYWTPIYTDNIFHVINKKVHGVKHSPTVLLLHDSWIEQ